MSPKILVLAGRDAGIEFVPVAGEDPDVLVADQPEEFLTVRAGHDLIGSADGRDHHPQPVPFAHGRVVNVAGGLAGGRQDPVGDRLQHPAGVGLDRTDLAGQQRHSEQVAQEVRRVFLAQSIPAGQLHRVRPQTRAVPAGHSGGKRAAGGKPEPANETVLLIFGHFGPDRRQFGHLKTQRIRVRPRQRFGTITAGGGETGDHDMAFGGRDERAELLVVARLAAVFLAGDGFRGSQLDRRTVARERLRGIARVLVQFRFEFRDFGEQHLNERHRLRRKRRHHLQGQFRHVLLLQFNIPVQKAQPRLVNSYEEPQRLHQRFLSRIPQQPLSLKPHQFGMRNDPCLELPPAALTFLGVDSTQATPFPDGEFRLAE